MTTRKDFPKPPGGCLICSDEQLAIVEVINGEIFAECHSPPDNTMKSNNIMKNWALEKITKTERNLSQHISNDEQIMLREEKFNYIDINGNVVWVYFKLPTSMGINDGGEQRSM